MFPKISIIIPIYNASNYLEETLQSIVLQSFEDWECVCVDDGSTDESVGIVQSFSHLDSRIKLYTRPANMPKGGNACRNHGFEIAKGQYVNWFDADDVMLPQFLSRKIEVAGDNDIIISSCYFSNENLTEHKKIGLYQTQDLYGEYFKWNFKIITNSVLFKKSFLNDKALFNINMKKSQEFEFFTRIFAKVRSEQIIIIEDYLFYYRSNPCSITSRNQVYNEQFKESEAYMLLQNLKRALDMRRMDVANKAYRLLINLLYKAVNNRHEVNVETITNTLKANLNRNNKTVTVAIETIIFLSKFVNLKLTRWDAFLKKVKIK